MTVTFQLRLHRYNLICTCAALPLCLLLFQFAPHQFKAKAGNRLEYLFRSAVIPSGACGTDSVTIDFAFRLGTVSPIALQEKRKQEGGEGEAAPKRKQRIYFLTIGSHCDRAGGVVKE